MKDGTPLLTRLQELLEMTVILLVQEFLHLWKCSVGSNLHPQNEFLHKNIYLNIVIYIVQKYQIDEQGRREDRWMDRPQFAISTTAVFFSNSSKGQFEKLHHSECVN